MINVMTWQDHIQEAINYSDGRYTLDDVIHRLETHTAQLWITERSAAITWLETYPRKTVLAIAFAGGDMHDVQTVLPEIEQFARDNDCDDVVIYGRRGWSRVLEDYEMVSVQARKIL